MLRTKINKHKIEVKGKMHTGVTKGDLTKTDGPAYYKIVPVELALGIGCHGGYNGYSRLV
jgi:hypothetical protein